MPTARALPIAAHCQNAHFLAVFFTEQRQRARFDGFIRGHQPRGNLIIGPDHGIDETFNLENFLRQ